MQAVYVAVLALQKLERQYSSCDHEHLAEGTDFTLLINAATAASVHYDPGIELESVSTNAPEAKRRSQFRVRSSELRTLYAAMQKTIL